MMKLRQSQRPRLLLVAAAAVVAGIGGHDAVVYMVAVGLAHMAPVRHRTHTIQAKLQKQRRDEAAAKSAAKASAGSSGGGGGGYRRA